MQCNNDKSFESGGEIHHIICMRKDLRVPIASWLKQEEEHKSYRHFVLHATWCRSELTKYKCFSWGPSFPFSSPKLRGKIQNGKPGFEATVALLSTYYGFVLSTYMTQRACAIHDTNLELLVGPLQTRHATLTHLWLCHWLNEPIQPPLHHGLLHK